MRKMKRNMQSAALKKRLGWMTRCLAVVLTLAAAAHAQQQAVESFLRQNEQTRGSRTPSALRGLVPNIFDQDALGRPLVDTRIVTPPLEDPVDPDTYIVGPGDNLLINVWGDLSKNFAVTVLPEGLIVIPTVGELQVNGNTLSEVKRRIVELVRPKYRAEKISTALLYPRQFLVTVSGAVNNPGSFVATPLDRVSTILMLANQPAPVHARLAADDSAFVLPSTLASDRNIEIRRQNGSVLKVDLRRYIAGGHLEENPRLMDGDVIYVPVRNTDGSAITVSGAVNVPGVYEYAEGDDLSTLLELAGGLTYSADRTRVEISRLHANPGPMPHTETIAVDLTRDRGMLKTPLKPKDRIFVRTAQAIQMEYYITVKGEVRYPGIYPIQPEGVPLSHAIEMAGGFTEDAFLKGGMIIRMPGGVDIPSADELEHIARLRLSKLGQQELADFEAQTRYRRQTVVADFVRLFEAGDPAADVMLQRRDIVVIPSRNETVTIIGQIANPGQIPYDPGRHLAYYIEQAGGLATHAREDRIRIIKAETYEWMPPEQTPIEIGDTIWVPRQPRRDYFAIFKETLQVMATLTTLYLVIQQIAK